MTETAKSPSVSVNAEREKARLSVREGAEYVSQGQQEHGRAALMMILTTSRPR
jgi:hypothetical protein